jgi:molybdopterin-synthase adenylyltransferase
MNERYSRQSFLGPHSNEVLAGSTIGIVGLGGGGSHIAQQLAHVGVGKLVLFDPDAMDWPNLNRTVGSTTADAKHGALKVAVAERTVKAANENVTVISLNTLWQDNLEWLRACDLVFGCIDGFIPRKALEDSCRRALIPLIDIGMDIYPGKDFQIAGQVIASIPGEPCFRCTGFVRDSDMATEESDYGRAGGTPQVIWPNGVLASTAVGIFMQMVTPWFSDGELPRFLAYDGNAMTVELDFRFDRVVSRQCPHYGPQNLGDPFWIPMREGVCEGLPESIINRFMKWCRALLNRSAATDLS